MKTNYFMLTLWLLMAMMSTTKAQGILDKIDKTVDKIDRASNTADRAAQKTEKAGKLGKKIGGLFAKGKKNDEGNGPILNTKIYINGVTLEKLEQINAGLQKRNGILSSESKFKKSGSTMMVSHSISTKELLNQIIISSDGSITRESVESLEDGQILIKIE